MRHASAPPCAPRHGGPLFVPRRDTAMRAMLRRQHARCATAQSRGVAKLQRPIMTHAWLSCAMHEGLTTFAMMIVRGRRGREVGLERACAGDEMTGDVRSGCEGWRGGY
jgi:hypothetical protein